MTGSNHRIATALVGVAAFVSTFATASATPTMQASTLQGIAGTWTCITQAGGKTYHETDVDSMYGKWLKIESTYPAQNGDPASTGMTFLGYDSKRGHWVVTGLGADGSYFTATSTSPKYDGSTWTDAFPADHGTAVIHMPSNARYTLDASQPGDKGKMETSHSVCTRS